MRTVKYLFIAGFVLAFFLVLGNSDPDAQSADKENHCFSCHTNARKLIQITRKIAAAKKDQSRAEVKSEGEG